MHDRRYNATTLLINLRLGGRVDADRDIANKSGMITPRYSFYPTLLITQCYNSGMQNTHIDQPQVPYSNLIQSCGRKRRSRPIQTPSEPILPRMQILPRVDQPILGHQGRILLRNGIPIPGNEPTTSRTKKLGGGGYLPWSLIGLDGKGVEVDVDKTDACGGVAAVVVEEDIAVECVPVETTGVPDSPDWTQRESRG